MRRREACRRGALARGVALPAVLFLLSTVTPLLTQPQETAKVPRIGLLALASPQTLLLRADRVIE
jgi:hypothetical protein